jgi:hypothetical protein
MLSLRRPAPASRSCVLASGCGRSTLTPPPGPTRLRPHDDLRTTTTGEGSPRHDPTPSEMPLSVQGGLRSPVACGATLQPHRRSSCDEAGR